MKIYHGSYLEVKRPDLTHSRKNLDFGRGFYCTENKNQAENWAKVKAKDNESKPTINVYDFTDNELCSHKKFEGYSEEWLMFIVSNRRQDKESPAPLYDIISGNIADDKVFQEVQNFVDNLIQDRVTDALIKATIEQLSFQKVNTQICFTSEKSLRTLKFDRSYTL